MWWSTPPWGTIGPASPPTCQASNSRGGASWLLSALWWSARSRRHPRQNWAPLVSPSAGAGRCKVCCGVHRFEVGRRAEDWCLKYPGSGGSSTVFSAFCTCALGRCRQRGDKLRGEWGAVPHSYPESTSGGGHAAIDARSILNWIVWTPCQD